MHDPKYKHHAWDSTAYLVDTFGSRLLGSKSLELAIDYLRNLFEMEGFENVRKENVKLSKKWVRGKEHISLFSPRPEETSIPMVGLGKSVGGNVTSEVVMIENFEELEQKGKAGILKDKIVFLNPKWENYKKTVKYRKHGGARSSKWGALGCVIRSITPFSTPIPHTGGISEDEEEDKIYKSIPSAAISTQSADMLARIIKRGHKVVLNIYMEAHFIEGDFESNNLIAEIKGSKYPDEIILIGGHIDSWDVGPQTGAWDDAGGVFVCYEAMRLLINLGLKPLRTIRLVIWTGEEFGKAESKGAEAYLKTHENEMQNHVLAFESDFGVSDIYGFGFTGGSKGFNLVKSIVNILFKDQGFSLLTRNDGYSSDITPLFKSHKIPIMRSLNFDTPDLKTYFTYYHSGADNMNVLNPDEMDRNAAAIASLFYILADVPWKLPRD
jgi:carboxypeptidase Q